MKHWARRLVLLVVVGLAALARRWPGKPVEVTILPAGQRLVRWLVRGGVRGWALRIAGVAGVLGIGGLAVAASGIIPIKASSGHWAITAWFLNFSMERSVSLHSAGIQAPPLDDPDLVLRGAGHYESGCRPCHGGPGMERPRIAAQMTPHPPALSPVLPNWEPAELFYIVKHGVKFTGMPAWPAPKRDDEIWAMVAFLQRLPALDADAYQALVHDTGRDVDVPLSNLIEPEGPPPAVAASCARCHGADGSGRGTGAFPRLAGQRPAYLFASLRAYARGARPSGIMEPVAAALSPDEMRALARYYASQTAPATPERHDPEAVERGEAIARRGIPARRVPSCADCHGPGGARRNAAYPVLAGQYADYLVQQLELFQEGIRGGGVYAHLMHPVAPRLTRDEMRDVARYYASLRADAPTP